MDDCSRDHVRVLIVASPQWCPPCRALLPELRKASIQLAGQMKFGTIDCTVHHGLCSMVTSSSRSDCVTICSSFLNLEVWQKCHVNQKPTPSCLWFHLFFPVQHPGLPDHGHLQRLVSAWIWRTSLGWRHPGVHSGAAELSPEQQPPLLFPVKQQQQRKTKQ